MSLKNSLPIAITTGDHRGIGPEVIAKGLYKLRNTIKPSQVVIFGDPVLYKKFKKYLPKNWATFSEPQIPQTPWAYEKKTTLSFVTADTSQKPENLHAAYSCGRYIELATKGALSGLFSAITTGPIDKNELQRGGYLFDGHTEMLQKICQAPSVTMMMAGPKMRVTLATTHVALKDVSQKLTQEKILTCIENTKKSLIDFFGIKKPKIAVLGLNPHASDNGLFGSEEATVILPALTAAQSRFLDTHCEGPFPPDGFFAQWRGRFSKNFDAVVCMYHDQGLIPVKLLDFENTVNVSLGLPVVRTSVDHGIGLDIAGKNLADETSFCAALKLALQISKKRKGAKTK